MGHSKSRSQREVYIDTGPHQETRNISKNTALLLKELEKEQKKTPKVSRRKKIIKIRAEKNETGTEKSIEKINEIELIFWKDKQNWYIFS